jgi:hypothetical protein
VWPLRKGETVEVVRMGRTTFARMTCRAIGQDGEIAEHAVAANRIDLQIPIGETLQAGDEILLRQAGSIDAAE